MQRLVDGVLGVAKESLKTVSHEAFSNTVRFINGFSAFLLAVLPAKASLEGIHEGWELRPTFRAPRLPQWMEDGVSSFNCFIHEFDTYSESESEPEDESGLEGNNNNSLLLPSSPSSPTSHVSRASSDNSSGLLIWHQKWRHSSSFWKRMGQELTWPFHAWGIRGHSQGMTPEGSFRGSSGLRGSHHRDSSSGSLSHIYSIATRHFSGVKDFIMMPKQTGDLRRGIIEDLQLSVELFIERVFDVVRNLIYSGLSPCETVKLLFKWCFYSNLYEHSQLETVNTATLGAADPTPQKHVKSEQNLNTDARTCEDVITGLGYPYEALQVTTADGHVLLLERIPRHAHFH